MRALASVKIKLTNIRKVTKCSFVSYPEVESHFCCRLYGTFLMIGLILLEVSKYDRLAGDVKDNAL